jgi:hypothetical protein
MGRMSYFGLQMLRGCPTWDAGLFSELGSGFSSGVDRQLRQHPLGMMPGSMGADPKLPRDGGVRFALGQKTSYLTLSPGKSISQIRIFARR